MKKFSKTLCLVLALVIALALTMTGCGQSSKNQDSTNPDTSASNNVSEPSTVTKTELAPYELIWYNDGPGPQKDVNLIEDEMNKYLKDKINTTVKIVSFDYGSYDQKVQTSLAAGEKVDLVFSCNWALNYTTSVSKGWLTDLTDLLDKYAPDIKQKLEANDWLSAEAVNGRIYNIPVIKEKAQNGGVIFNKSLVEKYGIDLSSIKTFKDLEPALMTVKQKDPTITPLVMSSAVTLWHASFGFNLLSANEVSYSIMFDKDTGKWVSIFRDPEAKDELTTVRKYFVEGLINKDAGTLKDYYALVKAGKAFSYPMTLKPGKDGEESKTTGIPLVQVNLTPPVSRQSDMVNSMMAIPKTAGDPARVLAFLNLFYKDQYLVNLMDYGIEGKHWVWVDKDKKIIDFAPETDGGKNSGWNAGANWMYGDQFLSYIFKNEDPEKWKKFDEFNKVAVKAEDFGFSFIADPVKKEVAALQNLDAEFYTGLFSGAMDTEKYLPMWESKAKAAGIDKVLEEMNKQFADFKAKK